MKKIVPILLVISLTSCSGYSTCEGEGTLETASSWHECEGRLAFKGYIYEGGFRFGEAHGYGEFEASRNYSKPLGFVISYKGSFNEGDRDGEGEAVYSRDTSKSTYTGQWLKNKPHGKGLMTYDPATDTSLIKYEGTLINGEPSGFGTYTYNDGSKYIGEIKEGRLEGQGKMYSKDIIHEGEFKNNVPDGKGVRTQTDKKLTGIFKGWNLNGQGKIEFASGDVLEGLFKNNRPSGQGSYTIDNGTKISGTFTTDSANNPIVIGTGNIEYPNGDIFSGFVNEYLERKQGTLEYANGDKYIGSFKVNDKHGQGTYYFANGDKYVGMFANNKFNGKGSYSANGEVLEGVFKDNVLESK